MIALKVVFGRAEGCCSPPRAKPPSLSPAEAAEPIVNEPFLLRMQVGVLAAENNGGLSDGLAGAWDVGAWDAGTWKGRGAAAAVSLLAPEVNTMVAAIKTAHRILRIHGEAISLES